MMAKVKAKKKNSLDLFWSLASGQSSSANMADSMRITATIRAIAAKARKAVDRVNLILITYDFFLSQLIFYLLNSAKIIVIYDV